MKKKKPNRLQERNGIAQNAINYFVSVQLLLEEGKVIKAYKTADNAINYLSGAMKTK